MTTDPLTATFAALADPTRRAILARLAAGQATVMELAAPFALSQPTISKHLKVLEAAGLISRGREAQRRPCRLRPAGMRAAAAWMGDFRRFWQESHDRLDDLLVEMKAEEAGRARSSRERKRHGRKD